MSCDIDKLLKEVLDEGFQLSPEALNSLSIIDNPEEIIARIITKIKGMADKPLVITKELIEQEVPFRERKKPAEEIKPLPVSITGRRKFKPIAKEIDAETEILRDPTGKLHGRGRVEDFVKYFRDRYDRLYNLFLQRGDLNVVPIADLSNYKNKETVRIVGMVTSKRTTKTGKLMLEMEDPQSSIQTIVPMLNEQLAEKATRIMLDQVICIEGFMNNNLLVTTDIIWLNTPTHHAPKKADVPVCAALISDTHVGNKTFLEDAFNRFISWMRGGIGSGKQREIAGQIKYLIIAGDVVDGIGIYPGQEEELAIKDIYEQYNASAEFIEQIPEYVEIIIIPGNHDATRQALPQPAIPEKYAKALYQIANVRMLGNPSQIRLHGVNFLVSHGRSLDDVAATIPRINVNKSAEVMKELLIGRHLAPQFGNIVQIAPEQQDWLVIEEIPDVFHAGHVHISGQRRYRNVTLINSGTWQSQTDYQRRRGITPTPGKAHIFNLQSHQSLVMNFLETCD
ncbi:MAG: DNA-directed DNA polymerase II small subunit [Candidatus Hodarchaeota archaeon]